MYGFEIPDKWKWFVESKYGLFIHWGPYSQIGRGEQVMFREHMDPVEYEKQACQWNPQSYDPREWARFAKDAGFKYACLTTRHHDGYCLWDTKYTDYSSVKQAPGRDFVREFVDAFRAEGLRIGLYYSWLDWRIPAFFEGPEKNPEGYRLMVEYMHNQVEELLSNYGQIDYFFFDGSWPRTAEELQSAKLVARMRELQPNILINNRLGSILNKTNATDGGAGAGGSQTMGDFGTPEHEIVAEAHRLWESCQVADWRLWGYTIGERWRNTDQLLDILCNCVQKGGNLIMNMGPDGEGRIPPEYQKRMLEIGEWLKIHGEALYGVEDYDLTEFITRGYQTIVGNQLYLIIRFWDGRPQLRLADLCSEVTEVTLLTTGEILPFQQEGEVLHIFGLPQESPTDLFPVIRISCKGKPVTNQWGRERLWSGDPRRISDWARQRGESFMANK